MTPQHKALFLETKGGQLGVKQVDIPTPAVGELLVKVEVTALNPIDWQIQSFGVFVENYPAVLGCDGAGTVVGVGEGVTSFVVGDRVAFQGSIDFLQKSMSGTFAQYTVTSAKFAAKIPANTSFEAAASIPCCLPTAACVLYNQDESTQSVGLQAPWTEGGRGRYVGKSALVLGGSSSVGQYVIQLARLSGFSSIVTTASLHNGDFLRTLGATHVLDRNLPAEQLQNEAEKHVGGLFDLVYDAVTLPDTIPIGYALTAIEGDFVVVSPQGSNAGKDDVNGTKKIHLARGLLTIPTNHIVGASLLASLPKLLEEGDIKPNRTEVLPGGLNGIAAGLERIKANQVSGVKLVVFPRETA